MSIKVARVILVYSVLVVLIETLTRFGSIIYLSGFNLDFTRFPSLLLYAIFYIVSLVMFTVLSYKIMRNDISKINMYLFALIISVFLYNMFYSFEIPYDYIWVLTIVAMVKILLGILPLMFQKKLGKIWVIILHSIFTVLVLLDFLNRLSLSFTNVIWSIQNGTNFVSIIGFIFQTQVLQVIYAFVLGLYFHQSYQDQQKEIYVE